MWHVTNTQAQATESGWPEGFHTPYSDASLCECQVPSTEQVTMILNRNKKEHPTRRYPYKVLHLLCISYRFIA